MIKSQSPHVSNGDSTKFAEMYHGFLLLLKCLSLSIQPVCNEAQVVPHITLSYMNSLQPNPSLGKSILGSGALITSQGGGIFFF